MAGQNQYIRVNGINITHFTIRRKMVDGYPIGEREVVVHAPSILEGLPELGAFAIDDSFLIELKDLSIPASERRSAKNRGWKTVSVADLLTTLESIESPLPKGR
jgi:hypothetical protein